MQMRFDGRLGFPGGYVDGEETLEEAVNREVKEELGCTSSPVDITSDNYVVSHYFDVDSEKLYLHFFAKKVTLQQFMELEKRPENLPHYGYEVCAASVLYVNHLIVKQEVLVQKVKPLLFSFLKARNLKFQFCNHDKLGV